MFNDNREDFLPEISSKILDTGKEKEQEFPSNYCLLQN